MISSCTWKDEFIGELDYFQRCLWIGLFSSCADDQGRMLDNPILIRADLFPYDDIQIDIIENGLALFEKQGKIVRYNNNKKKYIQLLKWWENQKPQWASRSKFPAPESWQDHVRTRENGKYITDNWDTRDQDEECSETSSPETFSRPIQAGRQYPVPVPITVPVPVPDPVVVEQGQPPDDDNLNDLCKTFTELTNRKAKPDQFMELSIAGATSDDMRTAFSEISEKNFIVSKPTGMIEPTLNVLSRRNGKGILNDQEDYRRYIKGEYGDVGVR